MIIKTQNSQAIIDIESPFIEIKVPQSTTNADTAMSQSVQLRYNKSDRIAILLGIYPTVVEAQKYLNAIFNAYKNGDKFIDLNNLQI